MDNDLQSRANGLIIGGTVLFLSLTIWGSGYAVGLRHGERQSDTRWTTALTRRHLAYWVIHPDGTKEIEFRYVPKVRATCVKYGKEE